MRRANRRRLGAGLLALLLGLPSPGSAEDGRRSLALSSVPSIAKMIGKALLEKEAGADIDDPAIAVESVSINGFNHEEIFAFAETPFFCPQGACRIRLYALVGDSYRDLLAGTEPLSVAPPDRIALLGTSNGNYNQIAFGDKVLRWDGGRYVDLAATVPSTLSRDTFLAACNQNKSLGMTIGYNDGDVAADQPQACGCVADGFAERGLNQTELDLFAGYLDHSQSEAEIDKIRKAWEWAYANGSEIQSECLAARGFEKPAKPPKVQVSIEPLSDVMPFVATCRGQDWVLGSDKIGSDDRALAFCFCLAGGMDRDGLVQEDFDGLIKVYDGTITEDDLTEARPETIAASDRASERCLNELPPR